MVLAIVLSFGAGFTLATWQSAPTMSDTLKMAAPTMSVILLAVLFYATLKVWQKMLRANIGKRWNNRAAWTGLIGSLLVAFVAFSWSYVGAMTVLNESIGAKIRTSSALSKLPEGNLFMAGGLFVEGWAYFAVFMGLVSFFTWNMIIKKASGIKSWRFSMPTRTKSESANAEESGPSAATEARRPEMEILEGDDALSALREQFHGAPA